MKKRVLALVLVAMMCVGMLTGCGAKSNGKVLNIYCWNNEFQNRVKDHYAGYQVIDDNTGKIGDVTVKWNITPSTDNAYQNNLDDTLLKQASADADDKIDIFLIEADYALKYVDTEYTMALSDLGIKDTDIADQFQYTKDVVTDANGKIKGASWQGCPGCLFYSRSAAKEIFGTDDTTTIQSKLKDWASYNQAAAEVAAKGYYMTATTNDTYRVYSNNVTSKWVVNGKVNIDKNIKAWAEDTKALYDKGYIKSTEDLWGAAWSEGFYPAGKVFCYFGPAWLINFCMAADQAGSIANSGDFAAIPGPQGFYWGGTWICAATGTDNAKLVKDIILKMTADESVLKEIVEKDDDFANNEKLMKEMATSSYASKVLGGQNPLGQYLEGAKKISLANISAYDQGCNEEFQRAMKSYFLGTSTYDEAVEAFYKKIVVKYPDLKY